MSQQAQKQAPGDAPAFRIGRYEFRSRLIVGSGKYASFEENLACVEVSGAEMVTVALRRVNFDAAKGPRLLDVIRPDRFTILPNTAGCYTAEEAVRTLRLARELLAGHALVKLEVLGDPHTLFPNMPETLAAAKTLVAEGFEVMVYCSDDPVYAKKLEDAGAAAIMPAAAPIGSGRGLQNFLNLGLIIEQSKVPVLVDAGVGTASDATLAMETGCDAVLMNTAIAGAQDPIRMAVAMKHAVIAGREAFLAGRMPKRMYADPSSPLSGLI